MPPKAELRCCLGCGCDTRSDYCPRCVGQGQFNGRHRGHPSRPVGDVPLEDDYSEESNADSVCNDNTASLGFASLGR